MIEEYATEAGFSANVALDRRFSRNPQGWFAWLGEQVELKPGMEILDLGCGTGELWKNIHERIPPDCRLVLADSSDEMLKAAREALNAEGIQACFDRVDMGRIPYEAGRFDIVITEKLYYVQNPADTVTQIARVLKPRGVMYAAAVGDMHLRELHRIAQRFSKGPWREKITGRFRLNGGGELLGKHFSGFSTVRYDDELIVSETQPLIRYIKSLPGIELGDESEDALQRYIDKEIRTLGHILVTKDAGLFVARR